MTGADVDLIHAAGELRGGIRELLFPRSLAVVGASDRTEAQAEILRNVLRGGIPVAGVHPSRADVLGMPCAPTAAELAFRPELALLLVGHSRVEEAFEDAAAAGVRAFVLPGLGAEAGAEGPPVVARIAARADELGVAVLGPNCMGVAVPEAASPWIGTLSPSFPRGRVATVVQSGSIGEALTALGPRVGFRCVVSSGGEAVRDAADVCAFLADDEETGAVGLFLEAVRRPAAFRAALERLAEADKPVVCLKVGRSPAGARAALTHTGAAVGSDEAFSALLRRYEAVEVDDVHDLVETLEVLGRRRRPRGLRIAAVSESGGECALLADRADEAGMPFEPLPDRLRAALQSEFPNFLDPGNPLDAWAIDAAERVYPRSLELLARSGEFDVLLAQVDLSRFRGEHEQVWNRLVVAALADACEGTDVFPAVTSVHTVDPPLELAELARDRDLALLRGAAHAVRALAAAGRRQPVRPAANDGAPIDLSDLVERPGPLPEWESSLALERYGVPFATRRRASSAEEAVAAAVELGFPVVVKLDGPPHKGREGGVIRDVAGPAAAHEAAARLAGPVLVAARATGVEACCGFVREPGYGAVLAVGPGGELAETRGLASVTLAPIDRELARRLVDSVPLLANAPAAAREELAAIVVSIGRLAADHPQVEAGDVNPILLSNDGAVAVDALLVIGETA